DGARRLRPPKTSLSDTDSFDGLWIRITANENEFRIEDNCGGIPLEVAVEYAFRFGRPHDVTDEQYEIPQYATGQFGVGMKRALFKLGGDFDVKAATKNTRFAMNVNVQDWLDLPEDDWHFDLDEAEEKVKVPKAE